jgi:hypothetical protein
METINTRDKNVIRKIVIDALDSLKLFTNPADVELLMGTWAIESNGGQYTHQLGNGPAHGLWQVERTTFIDVLTRCKRKHYAILQGAIDGRTPEDCFEDLITNHTFCAQVARLKYYLCPGFIPPTLQGQAEYWKKYYNTVFGAGTVEKYIEKYNEFVIN